MLIVAVGIVARAARSAVETLRKEGVKVGLLRPVTLWPFPEEATRRAARRARVVLTPEMNTGQLVREVERLVDDPAKVVGLHRIDGEPIAPAEIVAKVRELAAQ